MPERREFLKKAMSSAAIWMAPAFLVDQPLSGGSQETKNDEAIPFMSTSMDVQLSRTFPAFEALNIDGLGLSRRGANTLQSTGRAAGFVATVSTGGNIRRVEYRTSQQRADDLPQWTVELS